MISDSLRRVRTALLLLALAAACATPRGDDIAVSAAPAPGGVRVCFRRLKGGSGGRRPELAADAGSLTEIAISPDLLAASALWTGAEGALNCRFPYGGTATYRSGEPTDDTRSLYVLLAADGMRVTAEVPRACPVLPALALTVTVDERLLPVRLHAPGGGVVILDTATATVPLPLPRDRDGVLAGGDHVLRIETAAGDVHELLVTVDPDGTPAATTGYVDLDG